MERSLMGQLVSWNNITGRKPLILNGARQVGKTWLLKEFGSREYKNVAYINLDNDEGVRGLFASDHNVSRIVSGLSLLLGMDIVPEDTLVILDEIQSEPRAITALKYFCEEAP